jgi:GntR family transcriptional regulator / MocR family aminotransferase
MNTDLPRLMLRRFQRQAAEGLGLRDQLCETLRQAIRDGVAAPDERLPSTRTLAQDLSLSRVTVEAAYAQLEAEGYLRRKVGDGSFVDINMGVQTLAPKPAKRPAPVSEIVSKRGQRMLNTGGCMEPMQLQAFVAGSPDLQAFPAETWRHLSQRRLRRQAPELMRYGDPQGRSELREAIARYLVQSRGVRAQADNVLVLTSSQQALQLMALMLIDEGDAVWMEDPGYAGARTAFLSAGAQLVDMPIDRQGAVLDPTRPTPRLIYLTPSHQFPTGHTMSLERRLAFIAYAQRTGAWLIEDDYDSEFQYDGHAMPALQGLDHSDRVLYVGSFTKTLFPSVRLAYTVLPAGLVDAMVVARSIHDGHPAQLMQAVATDFINQGHFAAHLRLIRQLYHSRRDALVGALQQHLPWAPPLTCSSGLQLSVGLPPGSEARLTAQATALGIATPSLSQTYWSAPKVDGWRLGFAALPPERIVEGVKLLGKLRPAKKA